MTINERFVYFMKRKNIKQLEFASKLNVSQPTLSMILNNKLPPSKEVLIKFHRAYNINLNWLLCGNGTMIMSEKINDSEQETIIKEDIIEYKTINKNLEFYKKFCEEQDKRINNLTGYIKELENKINYLKNIMDKEKSEVEKLEKKISKTSG